MRAESAVEPTKSENITVTCRRSARSSGAALGALDAVASTDCVLLLASLRRAAMASSSFTRCPNDATPSSFRFSANSNSNAGVLRYQHTEAEAARVKAMAEKGGAAAAVSALTAKAKLAGMWRDKVDQHKTGTPAYEHIERIIVDARPDRAGRD